MIGSNIPNPPLTDETGKRIAEAIENISGGGEELDTIEVEFSGSGFLSDLVATDLTAGKYAEVLDALRNETARVIGVLHISTEDSSTTYTTTNVQMFSDPNNPLAEAVAFTWLASWLRYTVFVTQPEGGFPYPVGARELVTGRGCITFAMGDDDNLEAYMNGYELSTLISAIENESIDGVNAVLLGEGIYFSSTVTLTWEDDDTLLHCFFLDGNGDTIHVAAWVNDGEVACEIVT